MARPSKYETHVAPRLEEIKDWCRNGATDEEVAKRLGINIDTLYTYKKQFSEFSEAIKKGKEIFDSEVENALYERCIGGKVTLQRPFKVKRTRFEKGKKVSEEEVMVMADYEEYVIPDTTAQIFWLKNRRPDKWREKPPEKFDGEGAGMEGITINIKDCSEDGNKRT